MATTTIEHTLATTIATSLATSPATTTAFTSNITTTITSATNPPSALAIASQRKFGLLRGTCRTAGANKGSFDRMFGLSELECQLRCESNAKAVCVAFEHSQHGPDGQVCDLHKEPIRQVYKMPGYVCRIKPLPHLIAEFAGLLHVDNVANSPTSAVSTIAATLTTCFATILAPTLASTTLPANTIPNLTSTIAMLASTLASTLAFTTPKAILTPNPTITCGSTFKPTVASTLASTTLVATPIPTLTTFTTTLASWLAACATAGQLARVKCEGVSCS
eukprot:CAMPEP_0119305256 /NCGR_PEP_ID=MMETSP1333-20130426/6294_1 /TAXON_ID=418940 /ORGANISM="Scyphosphaera apsteinii, Strain RCC1455" /LENGTH=276 /DNA_ID=CAMNT_0007308303 /DNA_START=301 /DNA_END=1131 /DNA_ORIENTATION=+